MTRSDRETALAEESTPVIGAARRHRASDIALRVACHVAAAALFVAALVADLAHGWRPTGDDAIIAQRAWGVFTAVRRSSASSPRPVVRVQRHLRIPGRFSSGSSPFPSGGSVHGVLWGSRPPLPDRRGARRGGRLVGLAGGGGRPAAVVDVLAVVAAARPSWSSTPAWNISRQRRFVSSPPSCSRSPWPPVRLGWWPVLVGAGAIAAQAHLEFAPAAVGLVLLGLGLGLAGRPSTRRWAGSPPFWWSAPSAGSPPSVDELSPAGPGTSRPVALARPGPAEGTSSGSRRSGRHRPRPLWSAQRNRGSTPMPTSVSSGASATTLSSSE